MQELFCCPALLGQAELHFARGAVQCLTACGTTSKPAAGALKGLGFEPSPTSISKTYGTTGKPCPFKNPTPRVFRKRLSRFCPFAFTLALLSLFMVEDNSVSLVPAFVPACGCQRSR